MYRRLALTALLVLTIVVGGRTASAQVGVGAGIASSGADIRQSSMRIGDVAGDDEVTYADISGGTGFFATARLKYGFAGPLRFAGDVAYIFFPSREITVTNVTINGEKVSGTFDVGVTMLPVSAGIDVALPLPLLRPYVSAQAVYTFISRTSVWAGGDTELNSTEVTNSWEEESEFGASFGAGVELSLGFGALDIGARYTMADMLTSDDGASLQYLSLAATLYFGSTMGGGDDEDDDD